MPSKPPPIYPKEKRLLQDLGERLRLARLRRKITTETAAARAGISRMTLHRAEQGSPSVSLGTYLRILAVLGLENDLKHIAADDELGRRLQDLGLEAASKRRKRGRS